MYSCVYYIGDICYACEVHFGKYRIFSINSGSADSVLQSAESFDVSEQRSIESVLRRKKIVELQRWRKIGRVEVYEAMLWRQINGRTYSAGLYIV